MCFLRNRSTYSFETCTIVIGMPENLRVCWVWPSKYKGKWWFSPKWVFSEIHHNTALKLVPLQLACLKNSGCTEFGPLNTKKSDFLTQNVLFCCFSVYSLMHLLTRPMSSGPLDLFFIFEARNELAHIECKLLVYGTSKHYVRVSKESVRVCNTHCSLHFCTLLQAKVQCKVGYNF